MKRMIVLLICLMSGTVCLTGCTNNDEALIQKSYTAEGGEITAICIDVRDREIEVMRSPDHQIHIEYFESSKEYYDISVSDNHTLTMTAEHDKEWMDYIGLNSSSGSRSISLQVPEARLTTMNLSTTNEDISLPALTVIGDIDIEFIHH